MKGFVPNHQQRNASQGSRAGSQGPVASAQQINGYAANGPTNAALPQPKPQDRANSNGLAGTRGLGTPVNGNVGIVGRCAFVGSNGAAVAGSNNGGSLTRP